MQFRRLGALALALFLTACGGGGGGGAGNTAVSPGTSSSESLVPPVPALGAVLVENAADLRPMRDGARWDYVGTRRTPGSSVASATYTSSVTQRSNAAGLEERSENVYQDGDDTETVNFAAGRVQVQVADLFGTGSTEVTSVTELRSPVRVNDQYTHGLRENVSVGFDADGDGVIDKADIAMYSRVIGQEAVRIEAANVTVNAVRVDTFVVLRIRLSSTSQVPPPIQFVESKWYARGIGPVRRKLYGDIEVAGADDYEEVLQGYHDGANGGIGGLRPTVLRAPTGSALLTPPFSAAVALDTAALLVHGGNDDSVMTPTFAIAALDRMGNVQVVRSLAGLMENDTQVKLHRLDGSQALLVLGVAPRTSPTTTPARVRVQRVDPAANLVGPAVTLALGSEYVYQNAWLLDSAWDGTSLWVIWGRDAGSGRKQMMLQPFALDGQPQAAVEVLDETGLIFTRPAIAAANGRVVATWFNDDLLATDSLARYATRLNGGAAVVRTLATTSAFGSLDSESLTTGARYWPVVGSNYAAILWNRPNNSTVADIPSRVPHGVLLDSSGDPLRATVSVEGERLPANWTDQQREIFGSAAGAELVFAGQHWNQDVLNPAGDLTITDVRPGTAPLATTAAATATLRIPLVGFAARGGTEHVLAWNDRVLVIGSFVAPGNTQETAAVVVFLPPAYPPLP
jgi:hypothetical protein